MIEYERKALQGVPDYRAAELLPKRSEYCLLIPVINEGARILTELGRARQDRYRHLYRQSWSR